MWRQCDSGEWIGRTDCGNQRCGTAWDVVTGSVAWATSPIDCKRSTALQGLANLLHCRTNEPITLCTPPWHTRGRVYCASHRTTQLTATALWSLALACDTLWVVDDALEPVRLPPPTRTIMTHGVHSARHPRLHLRAPSQQVYCAIDVLERLPHHKRFVAVSALAKLLPTARCA